LELLDHPAKRIPYTPKEETTKTYNKLQFKSKTRVHESNGIETQPIKLKNKVKNGLNTNKILLALVGIISSFTTNFKPSANGCNTPKIPTTLGPRLR
jgi:hypothetical protein